MSVTGMDRYIVGLRSHRGCGSRSA